MSSYQFKYNPQKVFTMALDIKDLGNVGIHCFGSYTYRKMNFEADYYIVLKTVMGKTGVLVFGPVVIDARNVLAETFTLTFEKIDYKEVLIIKSINSVLNDPYKGIYKAEEMPVEEIEELIPNFSNYFQGDF